MSSNAIAPQSSGDAAPSPDKGKGRPDADVVMREDDIEDDDDDDDDDDEEEGEYVVDDNEEEELDDDDDLSEINPEAILPSTSRRTRGARVDYSSAEAHAKAGLKDADAEGDEEEDFESKDQT